MVQPVVRAGASLLFHAPGLVPHGSKPARDRRAGAPSAARLAESLRGAKEFAAYPPNQVFVGNLTPWQLHRLPRPWFSAVPAEAATEGPVGIIVSEEELYAWLLIADGFNLIAPCPAGLDAVREAAESSPLFGPAQRAALAERRPQAAGAGDLELAFGDGRPFAAVRSDHETDASLFADVLLENLACKASAAVALRWMLARAGVPAEAVDYVISTSEEAVGDRYQRGGGNLGKAVAELAGCRAASGSDVKDFCAGPLVGMVMAASLVASGVFRTVAVVGGGSLAKLGMKYGSHLAKGMPVLEDGLAATVALIRADGPGPVLRLDSVATARVGDDGSPLGLVEAVVRRPLRRLGLRFADVDRYVGELHNPEITEPAGGGDVPEKNYRAIAAGAVGAGELRREEIPTFVAARGVPGFAPTQGHVASGACYLPHVLEELRESQLARVMFIAKASCFLGRMTQLQDAISFIVEAPGRAGARSAGREEK